MDPEFTTVGWANKSPLLTPRHHFALASVNNKIYVIGGGGSNFQSLNSVEEYDLLTDRWVFKAPMPTVRSGAVAVSIGNNIYVMGGGFRHNNGCFEYYETTERYEHVTDRWERVHDMLMPHDYPAAVVVDKEIYLFGGHHPNSKGGPLNDPGFSFCERYNSKEDKWYEIAPMPTPRFAISAFVYDRYIYVIGGCGFKGDSFKNYNIIEVYDYISDRWIAAPHPYHPVTTPWNAAGSGVCAINNRFYLFGGNTGEEITDKAMYYDFILKRWMDISAMDQPRAVAGVAYIKGNIYVIGGLAGDKITPISSVIAYSIYI